MYGRTDLNQPATILELQDQADLGGGATQQAWVEVGQTWIRVQPKATGGQAGGLTTRLGGQVDATATHKVLARLPLTRADTTVIPLSENIRLNVKHQGLTLHVLSIINQFDRNERTELLCREVQG